MKLFYLFFLVIFLTPNLAIGKSECLNFHVIHSEPLGYLNEQGKVVGTHVDIINEVAKYTGLCIKTILMPYPRVWQGIELGKHDGGIVFRSKARAHIVDYVAKIRSVRVAVVARSPIELNTYDDLMGLSIAIRRGVHLSEQFDNDSELAIMEVNQYEQVIKMLMHDRVDAIAGSVFVLHYVLKVTNGLDKVDFSKKFNLGMKEQWLQLSKKSKHKDKIPMLNKAVQALISNGTLDEITEKYYGPQWKLINQ
jgi:polar amino acid transport system substrate-binding protein